ncbi:hypothetical protein [Hyphomicrobium sp. MC1]|uniref:hypothetical protein n=1 Tax=Hyphomicrobium sp. (strain MC1) TaxID=717785 RepID=UPI000213EB5D|nr:hypothetical protein [Hyphomicrobium sp. MC1]CCB66600.1 conserved protein of unknown function [Hyphomicrobium sp. MC1]
MQDGHHYTTTPLRGDRVTPEGLQERFPQLSFLGVLTCSHQTIIAGAWEEIVLDYVVGRSGIADGSRLKIAFKFYTDWALFQTREPQAANYISAEYRAGPLVAGQSPATVQALKISFDQKGHERPFQKALLIDIVDGYLNPGDLITIRLGDRRAGGPGTRVQTFTEKKFVFRAYLDPLGTSKFAAVPGDVALEIVPGAPAQLSIATPRLVRSGEGIPARVRVFDAWGNCCSGLDRAVEVNVEEDGTPPTKIDGAFPKEGWAAAKLEHSPRITNGEVRFRALIPDMPHLAPAEALVRVDPAFAAPRAWFADLHVHSDDTVGINNTEYNLTYGRDVAGLDILGYTANDFNITESNWNKAVELIHSLHSDGSFIAFPGTEWCGNSCAGGDHNVIFLHGGTPEFPFTRKAASARSFEWNAEMKGGDIEPQVWPLENLWDIYGADPEGHLLIPHVGGRRANLDWHDPSLERLIEVASTWGHFDWFYQDAISRGYKLGASAAGDEHRGRCGGGSPGAAVFGVKGGLTGVIAPTLTRVEIARALRSRHTWATTGSRLVGLLSHGEFIQGDEFSANGPARLNYHLLGDGAWDYIAAHDHSGEIWRRDLHQEAGYGERRFRFRWGGARVRDRYRAARWSGVIKISNATIHAIEAFGFEHPEEAAWRNGATNIAFRSETYGDADSIEIDASGLAHATISIEGTIGEYQKIADPQSSASFSHCPTFRWDVSGAELIANGNLRKDLGGAGLFLALERLTDKRLPNDVSGEIQIEPVNGPFGFRPVYLFARQQDDEKLWTSPLFIHFR